MNFIQMLNAAWRRTDSMLCVGLDPEPARFPPPLTGRADTILEFCRAIVDATAPLCMRLQAANRVFLGVSRRGAVRETDCVYPYAIPRRSGHSGCETRRYWQHGGALCARSL